MRYRSKALWIFAAVAALCAATSAADAQADFGGSAYNYEHGYAPPAGYGRAYGAAGYGSAYDAAGYGSAYDAYGPIGARGAEHSGTSVPYDADGPSWNDFQLQGQN